MPTSLGTYLGNRQGTILGTDPDGDELAGIEAYLAQILFSWIRADYRAESGGKVTAFFDKVNAGVGARAIDTNHALSQGNSAFQPAASAPKAAWNNREVSVFDTARDRWMQSTLANTAWAFLSDGTGAQVWLVCAWADATTSAVALTTRTANAGLTLYRGIGTNSATIFQTNGPSVAINNVLNNNTPCYLSYKYKDGNSPEYVFSVKSIGIAGGQLTGSAASAGTPENSLILGFNTVANGFPGDFAEVIIANQVSATLETNVLRYLALRYLLV